MENTQTNNILMVKDLRVSYSQEAGSVFRPKKDLDVLKGVSFSIREGEVMGLVGESGCGKSTLSKALLGLIPKYEGVIVQKSEHPQMISQGPSICIFNKEDPQEVLYSWLFTQYLLTDGIQIAYSQTEGYVPVTTSAQESPAYQDYLARAGEDNDTYYQVKIDAAKLLLDNLDNTFTTPVFNGSTSLRDAAGQLIEDVTKAERRKQEVTEASIDQLYQDTQALYHLDSISPSGGGKTELGALPSTAVALLAALAGAWALILLYVAVQWFRKRRKAKNGPLPHK